ncbi:MAG: flagellar M-ring protein FliF C-terminal domain-containing protein [Phycisphaerales bacterium]
MDQLRQMMGNISSQVGKMTASQKLLLASLTVIGVMTLFLVSQYAAKPAVVDLMAADGQTDVVQALQTGGYDAQLVDGKVVIPAGQQRGALSYLAESGQLPGDTTLLFSNLIGSQDWKASSAQHRQQYYIALQNELTRRLTDFTSLSKASVILDVPQASGLGRASRAPSASVTLFSRSGGSLPQPLVDAAARLVAGAVSGLDPLQVQIIDGISGRARNTSNEESESSSRYLEYASKMEKHTKEKIEGLFGYIPGVVVSVTARVDVTSVQSAQTMYAPSGKGSTKIETSKSSHTDSTQQGGQGSESGVRANQTASINTGGGIGTKSDNQIDESNFATAIGSTVKNVLDPRGMPTMLSASVIIPQEYIESVIERSRPVAEGEEPTPITDSEAQDFFNSYKPVIESLIKPHLVVIDDTGISVEGKLMVSMAPLGVSMNPAASLQSAGFMSQLTSGGGNGVLGSGNGLIETALVGVLAVISLGMMAMMVKRSSQKIDLPSAHELVGVPPDLDTVGDLVGEASEGDHVMTGIEVEDALIEVQKIREQVAELIKQDPESAAGLVERWAEHEES